MALFLIKTINMMNAAISFNKTLQIGGDITVNRMGYGAMRITGKGIWGPPKDEEEAIGVLKRTIELGVNFIDTADSYGPHISEELIADALYPYPTGLVIGTKGGLLRSGPDQWPVDASPAHLREALEGSLKRLKLEQIDLYQLHRVDNNVPAEESFKFLKNAQNEGLIKHIGLSEVDIDTIKKAQEFFEVVSVQNMYSVDNRKWENVLQHCKAHDIVFIPWFPLNAGNVVSQDKLKQIAEKNNATVHQVALNWLLHHADNILLIPGTSSIAHLEENMQAADLELNENDIGELNGIAAQ
ncbi:MAG TPA: aldo/keto reductase [Mucilaginibacter sp.]|jgi:aryl-alcohol dehydrogenase-like predicted oxidoreductase